jgi:hypothetical protein
MQTLGYLTLSHSGRATQPERCTVQALTRRFQDPDRLRQLPPLASLPPASSLYSGALSFYRVTVDEVPAVIAGGEPTGVRIVPLGSLRSRRKIQHAAWLDDLRLLVCYEHQVEQWRLDRSLHSVRHLESRSFTMENRFAHRHLAGLHTAEPLSAHRVLLSSSGADAVLVLDLAAQRVEQTLRMPERLYGTNYPLDPEIDLHRHYIHDNVQITHLNAASPDRQGRWVAVSALIPGAVGVFDLRTRGYEEITRGFVGCHGARFNDQDEIYFADSTTGHLVFLGEGGRVARRFAVDSRWLHDVQQICGPLYAFALADRNELRIYDVAAARLLYREVFAQAPFENLPRDAPLPSGWLGNSTQALSFQSFVVP